MVVDNMWLFVISRMGSLGDLLVVLITKGGEREFAVAGSGCSEWLSCLKCWSEDAGCEIKGRFGGV